MSSVNPSVGISHLAVNFIELQAIHDLVEDHQMPWLVKDLSMLHKQQML